MAEPFLTLHGCAPTPLASYLKALGVLRLLASAGNNVKGEAADPTVRGWWAGERFHLKTRLDRDALVRFFLEDYAPSSIIAPWNGGSGFYYREGKTKEKDPTTGKMIKTGVRNAPTEATRRIDAFAASKSPRFKRIAEAIAVARTVIHEFGFYEAPDLKSGKKAALIARYRSVVDEEATGWIDAALAIVGEQFDPAAVLGSGGNDGNLDFSTTFQAALMSVMNIEDGSGRSGSSAALDVALFDSAVTGAQAAGVSQLAPGTICAPNSGTGFVGVERGISWSLILMFEGAMAFAGTATRYGAANRTRGSFPFSVSQLASGSGAVGGEDDSSNRAVELWLPLWNRPATFAELRGLFGEGKAHIGRTEARDGLTFARAVSALGVSRGIEEFIRLGFEARYGNMFITVPLGRFRTPERPRRDLVADLDAGGWLTRLRRAAGKNAPARARMAVRRLEDALFAVARGEPKRDGLQAALAALGGVTGWLATSREARERDGRENVAPPPRLSHAWVREADDGSPEFRVAVALASLGWPATPAKGGVADTHEMGEAHDEEEPPVSLANEEDEEDEEDDGGEPADAAGVGEGSGTKSAPPMASHFTPVDEATVFRRNPRRSWAKNDPPGIVWGSGGLVQNMIAVLERRLIEQAMRGLEDKPLAGACPARLSDVAAFLEGPPAFDDARCAALLSGLVWADPAPLPRRPREDASEITNEPVSFAYAALKPLFTPDDDLREPQGTGADQDAARRLPPRGSLPIPPGLVSRLRRGAVDEAVRVALARARASGIASPFDPGGRAAKGVNFGAAVEPVRLAAALLIPIDRYALARLVERAYPNDPRKEDANNAA